MWYKLENNCCVDNQSFLASCCQITKWLLFRTYVIVMSHMSSETHGHSSWYFSRWLTGAKSVTWWKPRRSTVARARSIGGRPSPSWTSCPRRANWTESHWLSHAVPPFSTRPSTSASSRSTTPLTRARPCSTFNEPVRRRSRPTASSTFRRPWRLRNTIRSRIPTPIKVSSTPAQLPAFHWNSCTLQLWWIIDGVAGQRQAS